MTPKIVLLDENTKNLIAAGEVIERPASVVKELLENSLDAGAGRITVELEGAGNILIRVSDDGSGMGREDAETCFKRHATSKITTADDLKKIATLGFRGEALPSIASISRFELLTASADNPAATKVVIEGGKVLEITEANRAAGTTASVRNLFFNVPARRKFLKTDRTELRNIISVVTSLAISQIETGFKLIHEGRELINTSPCASVFDRVIELFGEKRAGKLVTVISERGDLAVGGLVAAPDSSGSSRPDQYMFINRRPFTSRSIVHAVKRAYQSTIPESVQPSFFLFLTVDPAMVDVNVHPAKLEVRFRDEGLIYSIVYKAVREGLQQEGAVAGMESWSTGRLVSMGHAGMQVQTHGDRMKMGYVNASIDKNAEKRLQTSFFAPMKSGAVDEINETPVFNKSDEPQAEGPAEQAKPENEMRYSVLPGIWQLHGRYLLVETKEGMLMIDQHAAHERIIYERIMEGFKRGGVTTQRLLFPQTVELSPEEFQAAEEFGVLLEQAGFEVEHFGGRSVVVRSVPSIGAGLSDIAGSVRNLLDDLSREGLGSTGTRHQALARSLACKAAIKSGKKLTAEEMTELVDQLFATELPYADVHGRNTIIQVSLDELDKRFGRK